MHRLDETRTYWDGYYASKTAQRIPSQFAAFVLSEFYDRTRFVDLGCGNGRDSFFFAENGKQVLGADGSEVAVQSNQADAKAAFPDKLRFEHLDFAQPESCARFLEHNGADWSDAIIYARFFLHAIDEATEEKFFQLCNTLLGANGLICLEFRTDRDELQRKETAAHYRRFINPINFINNLGKYGLKAEYFCEGFGLAKYKNDDAHVARFVLAKQC